MRITAIFLALLGSGCASIEPPATPEPSPYLLIFASDEDGQDDDFFAVVDVRPGSATRGQVIATEPTGHRNSMPHHMEYELPAGGHLLFANVHHAETTLLVDVSRAPAISIRRRLQPPAPFRFTHDYARMPNGNVLM